MYIFLEKPLCNNNHGDHGANKANTIMIYQVGQESATF
jgi:hypothetical protein